MSIFFQKASNFLFFLLRTVTFQNRHAKMVNMFEMIVVNDASHRPDACDLRVSHDNSTWKTHASFHVSATDSIQRFIFPQSSALLWQLRIISTSGNAEPHIRDVQFLFGNAWWLFFQTKMFQYYHPYFVFSAIFDSDDKVLSASHLLCRIAHQNLFVEKNFQSEVIIRFHKRR